MAHISGLPNPLDDEKPTQIALYRGNSGPGDEYLLSNMYYDPEGVALRIDNVVFKVSAGHHSDCREDTHCFSDIAEQTRSGLARLSRDVRIAATSEPRSSGHTNTSDH